MCAQIAIVMFGLKAYASFGSGWEWGSEKCCQVSVRFAVLTCYPMSEMYWLNLEGNWIYALAYSQDGIVGFQRSRDILQV